MPSAPSAKFWDNVAASYAERPVGDEAAYQQKLNVTREYFTPESTVLEFGAGTGSTALAHAPFVKSILATDISAEMMNIARGKAEASGVSNVTFQQATLDDLDAVDGAYDAVLGLNILHLLPEWESAITKSFALLKPGGVFVTSTGCLGDGFSLFRFVIPVMRLIGKAPYVGYLGKDQVRDAMSRAGFTIDHDWVPDGSRTLFLVARKPA